MRENSYTEELEMRRVQSYEEDGRSRVESRVRHPSCSNEYEGCVKGIGNDEMIDCRPADLFRPDMRESRPRFDGVSKSDGGSFGCIWFPQVALDFIRRHRGVGSRNNG